MTEPPIITRILWECECCGWLGSLKEDHECMIATCGDLCEVLGDWLRPEASARWKTTKWQKIT